MSEWIEYAKIIGSFAGAVGIGTLAKLYHDKLMAGKDTELAIRDDQIARLRADLVRTEERARHAEADPLPEYRDLAKLRTQLTDMLERLASKLHVQAASLYIPVFNAGDDDHVSPRSFGFVAACNVDPEAAAAILRMKLVETWTIVGECWDKGTLISSNDLQANVRHLASYDKQSGFVPVHTMVAPVRWQNRPVGIVQLFNKTLAGDIHEIDPNGFGSDDRKVLTASLQEAGENSISGKMNYFQSSPHALHMLGLQDELDLENAVIMSVDLTRSSSLYSEVPLVDSARLLNRFSEYVYQRTQQHAGIVEKFNGDGTLVRFHYGSFDAPATSGNPVLRAILAATDLIQDFSTFKASRWQGLDQATAASIKLRITLALGPVISIDMGPQQVRSPTVMGGCVNRSAKMVAHAPRDRDVVLVDDNFSKALKQIAERHMDALSPFDDWSDAGATEMPSLRGHAYFEVATASFGHNAPELRPGSPRRPG